MTRRLNPDRVYTTPDGGGELTLPGRSLMLVRNVGHLMMDAIACSTATASQCRKASSTAVVTSLIAHARPQGQRPRRGTAAPARSTSSNRRCTGRRKSPSPTSCSTASRTRSAWPRNTLKMGIMDEERRTTVNLKECIRAARDRIVLHQHRLPRPHRRRNPHLDGSRAR